MDAHEVKTIVGQVISESLTGLRSRLEEIEKAYERTSEWAQKADGRAVMWETYAGIARDERDMLARQIHAVTESEKPCADAKVKDDRPWRYVWMVEDPGGRRIFTKIGIAREERDGSWSIELSAIPVNGRIQLRPPSLKAPR